MEILGHEILSNGLSMYISLSHCSPVACEASRLFMHSSACGSQPLNLQPENISIVRLFIHVVESCTTIGSVAEDKVEIEGESHGIAAPP